MEMFSRSRMIAWLLVLMMVPGFVSAKRLGRLVGMVSDPDGNPLEGVQVTATSKDLPEFRQIVVTNKKGVFKLDFSVVEVVYTYIFKKSGYQTMQYQQPWSKPGTSRTQFTLYPEGSEAIEGLKTSSGADPVAEAYNNGATAFQKGDYEAALASFDKALELEPDLHQAWGAKASTLLELGRYQEAAEAAEKSIALGSTSVVVLRTRWKAYDKLGDEEKTAQALAALEEKSSLAEEAKVVYNEGVLHLQKEEFEAAFAKFKESCELDPTLLEAQQALAVCSLRLGHNQEALAAAKAILEEHPDDEKAIKIQYNAAIELGDEDQLVEALVKMAQIDKEGAVKGLWTLGDRAFNENDYDLAKARFTKLIQIDPDYAATYYSLGLIAVNEQANDEARRNLTRFLELAPDDPDAATARDLLNYLGNK